MPKILFTLLLVAALLGCQSNTQEKLLTNYKEITSFQNEDGYFREINICRDGAIADNAVFHVYLDDEFVLKITQSIVGKSRVKIYAKPEVRTLRINAVNAKGNFNVFQLPLNNQEKKLYLISESKTKSFIPIPLPGMMITRMSGDRKIHGVTQSNFDEICGGTSVVLYAK